MKKRELVILFFLIITNSLTAQEELQPASTPDMITIFVHGIISVKPYLNIPNVVKLVRDKIANTVYAHTIQVTRQDEFFYQQHPMLTLGLQEIDPTIIAKGAAASAYVQLFNKIDLLSGHEYKNHVYYTFGWSGLLSQRMRTLEAKIFYNHLMKELGHFLEQPNRPKIRMVCYSHGANVALKIAEVDAEEHFADERKLIIDEMILVGAPVLTETDYLINNPMFKKIYHFYSYGDRVQRLDFFALNRVFSSRIFKPRLDFSLPEKLIQINVRIKRPTPLAPRACTPEEQRVALRKYRFMRNADPGHSELWAFGWNPLSYRAKFPLHPLPFTVLTPYLIAQINNAPLTAQHVAVEIHPAYEHMVIYNEITKKNCFAPFFKKTELNELQQLALLYKPENFDAASYLARIEKAKLEGKKRWCAEKNSKQKN